MPPPFNVNASSVSFTNLSLAKTVWTSTRGGEKNHWANLKNPSSQVLSCISGLPWSNSLQAIPLLGQQRVCFHYRLVCGVITVHTGVTGRLEKCVLAAGVTPGYCSCRVRSPYAKVRDPVSEFLCTGLWCKGGRTRPLQEKIIVRLVSGG